MDKQKIILVVEDESSLRMIIVERLEELGYKVHQAKDGEEGFDIAREVKPDLVISDIIMPKKNGGQLLVDLRGTDIGKDFPFIAITARLELEEQFKEISNTIFIGKPFKLKKLVEIIDEIFEGTNKEPSKEESESQKKSNDKDPGILVQEEILLKEPMLDVGKKVDKTVVLEEEKRKGQWEGRSRIHKSAKKNPDL
ncbi:MAG: response regulator [Candidatus Omnitrophica bacterium]|nr:response regulator [Candidatus Omnitrophota bacterium]